MHQGPPLPPLPPEQRRIQEAARQLIAALEARQLNAASVRTPGTLGILQRSETFWRVEQLGRFWEDAAGRPVLAYERLMQDLLSGLSGQGGPLIYLLWNDGLSLHV